MIVVAHPIVVFVDCKLVASCTLEVIADHFVLCSVFVFYCFLLRLLRLWSILVLRPILSHSHLVEASLLCLVELVVAFKLQLFLLLPRCVKSSLHHVPYHCVG